MLLIKQTLEHSPAERVIALNGPLVQLGTFSDILNDKALKNNIEEVGIGWEIKHSTESNEVNALYMGELQVTHSCLEFSFDTVGPVSERATLELQPGLRAARMTAALTDGAGERHDLSIAIERVTGRGRRLQFDSSTLGDDAKLRFRIAELDIETEDAARLTLVPSTVVGANVSHFSPSALIVRFDRNLRLAKQAATMLVDPSGRRRFRIPPLKLPQSVIEIMRTAVTPLAEQTRYADSINRIFSTNGPELSVDIVNQRLQEVSPVVRRSLREALSKHVNSISDHIYRELNRDITVSLVRVEQISKVTGATDQYFRFFLRYLGPLRADPRPLYPLQALGSPTDVGPKGEQTAAVLHLNAKRKIKCISPSSFKDGVEKLPPDETILATAVGEWLSYLGVADDFETIEKGKLGHELRVRTPGTSDFQDLTNVGVGVSQVLPIVVTCLLAPPGSTIILEQPELHLHPAVQARLADFFLAMILLNKQCIVETHSEHLIERIRFRVAQDWSNEVHLKTRIYFFSKENGSTTTKEISVNRFGSIDDWPKDFFDQSQIANEEIVMMALRRHKAERAALERKKGDD